MKKDLLQRLSFSKSPTHQGFDLPISLIESLSLIETFFVKNSNNKLCIVLPSRDHSAIWLTIPIVLNQIHGNYTTYNSEIFDAYKKYKPGQKLLLNNKAVVQWVGGDEDDFTFMTKGKTSRTNPWSNTKGDRITISTSRINNLRPAPETRKLSSQKMVYANLKPKSKFPLDQLLSINSNGNLLFQKDKTCLVCKYKDLHDCVNDLKLNNLEISEYISFGKLDEVGHVNENNSIFLTNGFRNLHAHLRQGGTVSNIIIDGLVAFQSGMTDFADIESLNLNVPTVLFVDLSEISGINIIRDLGFDIFNFTKQHLLQVNPRSESPFSHFERKLNRYSHFHFEKEVCNDNEIEAIVREIHQIHDDESNAELITIKIGLFRLVQSITRIVSPIGSESIRELIERLDLIDSVFLKNRSWIGQAVKPIDLAISLARHLLERLRNDNTEKSKRLDQLLLSTKRFDFILCITEDECNKLNDHLESLSLERPPKVLTISNYNSHFDSARTSRRVLLTAWPKGTVLNGLVFSFQFSSLSLLLYPFEERYFKSLQRRNSTSMMEVNSSVNIAGERIHNDEGSKNSFDSLFGDDLDNETSGPEAVIDIVDFELKLDSAIYSKYVANSNEVESLRARRIDFENDKFIYSTEAHSFLVINDLVNTLDGSGSIKKDKLENLRVGDVIAFISTDRGILVDLVEKRIETEELSQVKHWTELWKNLLRMHYYEVGRNFERLLAGLREQGCSKDEATIKTWLFDDARIGPRDDEDLVSIAALTRSRELKENINTVRAAITQMKGWRHDASDFVIKQIKNEIRKYGTKLPVNSKILIEELGTVDILTVTEVGSKWQQIDNRYTNRLLDKEM